MKIIVLLIFANLNTSTIPSTAWDKSHFKFDTTKKYVKVEEITILHNETVDKVNMCIVDINSMKGKGNEYKVKGHCDNLVKHINEL